MNGTERSLAVARIQQKYVERLNTIIELLCNLLKIPYMAFVGSSAEGTDNDESDKDTIWFSDYYDGFDSLTILPDERHPGYSKIQVGYEPKKSELYDYTVEIDDKNYLKNSVKKIIKDRALSHFPSELSSHGAAYTAVVHSIPGESILQIRDSEEVDHVLCIKRPDWPDEAAEWKTRNMHSNWPTDKLVTKITKSGYLLTAVGSKESIESEIQWRVSFNEAELLLIKSFNETQLHCIRLLKLLKKDLSKIAAKNITSYTMKNIMFWCLEKKSNDYWQPSNLMCCFCFCLSELLSCVENEFLSNYFIRKRNLFISREFTCDQRIQTCQYLKRFINDPKTSICLL
ncbi:Hypothetical predicted protein [Mytilus galloprovincialis]|uniref:Mab-21-like nucleotidyltransferase domain-containing protein n=1 Tax=Mytilus galloprovincialis TaxID=29158 RepID=A0A8B6HIA6_MYTGA|nr:Hypothetical predicted protein [Mytilus galloprovincialis]